MMQTNAEKKVIPLFRWEVVTFSWGVAVREQRTGRWTWVILNFNGQEIDLEGIKVDLYENGIEFL
jgi:hypothetical protein